jgi:hypothetical protein
MDRPLNLVAYHTGVLKRDGYIEVAHTERRRGALTRFYRATARLEIDGADWEALPIETRRALVAGTLEQVHVEARQAALRGAFDGPDGHLSRIPMTLDDQGVTAVADLLRAAAARIDAIATASRERDSPATLPLEVVTTAFEWPAGAP